MNTFYLTTAIPYVNAKPHIGHALEFIQADVIARYRKLLGDDVLLLSGGDENALKNVQAAEKEGIPVQEFIDKNSQLFADLAQALHVRFDVFQKGSSLKHHASSQRLWNLCYDNGDIYKKTYTGLYCVGCEAFYEKEELTEQGECPEHPGKQLEEISEENYFFKLSKYQQQLIELIESNTLRITPEKRKNEILSFLKQPLQDISISRSNERAKGWGVPIPQDPQQRMYVWFDALNIYQSGVGFNWNKDMYRKWWPADLHVIGKGIIRFHAIYWPAFLLSAKLPLPKALLVHEYFTVNGQKMSKTLGNVIDPFDLIKTYGAEALRLYFLKHFSPFSDGDFSEDKFKEAYNADLANGLGNLIARVAKLCERNTIEGTDISAELDSALKEKLRNYKFNEALDHIWEAIKEADKRINDARPWELEKEKAKVVLEDLVKRIQHIAFNLQPFLPETAEKILKQFSGEVKSQQPLFPRIV